MNSLVLGAAGFIGRHLCRRLKSRGHYVVGVDYDRSTASSVMWNNPADMFHWADLSRQEHAKRIYDSAYLYDAVYNLAADMGGAGFIFSGKYDADLMTNSALINLNLARGLRANEFRGKLFFSSSACVYSHLVQGDPSNPGLREADAYPAWPDSPYGWEKLFAEILYDAYRRNCGFDVRVARFHNVYGPEGAFQGGREKAPAAICRKVAEAPDGGEIEVWGDGEQTRSFLFIDDCLDGVEALMASDCTEPRNIGSTEMVSINQLAKMVIEISGKKLGIRHIEGPLGVRGRNSNNELMERDTGWSPKVSLREGLERTYRWVAEQVAK